MSNFYLKTNYYLDQIIDEIPGLTLVQSPLLKLLAQNLKQGLNLLIFRNKEKVTKRDLLIIESLYINFYDFIPDSEKGNQTIFNSHRSIIHLFNHLKYKLINQYDIA